MRNRSIRASDADREAVASALRDHAVAGRLTTEELGERIGRALSARTLGELDAVVVDLPRAARHGSTATILSLLLQGALWLIVGLILLTVAIVLAVAWTGARLACVAVRSVQSRHSPRYAGPSRSQRLPAMSVNTTTRP